MRRVIRRPSPVAVLAAVREVVEAGTGRACVVDPDWRESPLYWVELVGSRPGQSKSARLDEFEVELHAVAPPARSQAAVLDMVAAAEEAMEAWPVMASPFRVVDVAEQGIRQVKVDESGEWHAIVAYEIAVSYGLICK